MLKTTCMALSVLMMPPQLEARAHETRTMEEKSSIRGSEHKFVPLQTNSPLKALLDHPAFFGYARLLLPWDDRDYDKQMPLARIGTLLPYHSRVDPASVVQALNRIIEDVGQGKAVLHDFYGDAAKQAQPSKRDTGLFFFRGRPGAPFALIAPGGGFSYVGSVHEGFPYAMEINKTGYNVFVLKYRVGQGSTVATQDMAAALTFVVRHAQTLGVSPKGYSLWGSSAGARMAANIGSHGAVTFGGDLLPPPAAVVMAYTGHTDYTAKEPPTFVVIGEQDSIASPDIMARRVNQLRESGTEVEFHRFPGLGHGFGTGIGTCAEGWLARATQFWSRQI